ncbi:MAG: hypothetical protein ACYS30_26220 [Planctomycetota bacterium]|jgi:hypothetical protein
MSGTNDVEFKICIPISRSAFQMQLNGYGSIGQTRVVWNSSNTADPYRSDNYADPAELEEAHAKILNWAREHNIEVKSVAE